MISLGLQLRRVRRRLLSIGTAAAAMWGLAAVTILLLLGAWLDLLWEFPPQWRIATFWAAGAAGAAMLGTLSAVTLRAARDAAVARRLDRAGDVGGQILTGWELAQEGWDRRSSQPQRALTLSLANIAVADAAVAAGQIPLGRVAPVKWKFVYRALVNHLSEGACRSVNHFGFGRDIHALRHFAQL